MAIQQQLVLMVQHGIKPQDVDSTYVVIGLCILVPSIYCFTVSKLITFFIGLVLLYFSLYMIVHSYQPTIIENE